MLDAFAAAGGNAVKLPDGEFVDLPVADRARRLLELLANVADAGASGVIDGGYRTSALSRPSQSVTVIWCYGDMAGMVLIDSSHEDQARRLQEDEWWRLGEMRTIALRLRARILGVRARLAVPVAVLPVSAN